MLRQRNGTGSARVSRGGLVKKFPSRDIVIRPSSGRLQPGICTELMGGTPTLLLIASGFVGLGTEERLQCLAATPGPEMALGNRGNGFPASRLAIA